MSEVSSNSPTLSHQTHNSNLERNGTTITVLPPFSEPALEDCHAMNRSLEMLQSAVDYSRYSASDQVLRALQKNVSSQTRRQNQAQNHAYSSPLLSTRTHHNLSLSESDSDNGEMCSSQSTQKTVSTTNSNLYREMDESGNRSAPASLLERAKVGTEFDCGSNHRKVAGERVESMMWSLDLDADNELEAKMVSDFERPTQRRTQLQMQPQIQAHIQDKRQNQLLHHDHLAHLKRGTNLNAASDHVNSPNSTQSHSDNTLSKSYTTPLCSCDLSISQPQPQMKIRSPKPPSTPPPASAHISHVTNASLAHSLSLSLATSQAETINCGHCGLLRSNSLPQSPTQLSLSKTTTPISNHVRMDNLSLSAVVEGHERELTRQQAHQSIDNSYSQSLSQSQSLPCPLPSEYNETGSQSNGHAAIPVLTEPHFTPLSSSFNRNNLDDLTEVLN